jgi:hypothetical protein
MKPSRYVVGKEFYLGQREAVPSEGFQKMELKLLNTLHLHFIE